MLTEWNEPPCDKTNKMACAPSKDSDQPGHLPSLIRVFTVRVKKAWVLSYPLSAQRRLWSDWADAQADLSLRWAHMPFCWFCHEVAQMANSVDPDQTALNRKDLNNACMLTLFYVHVLFGQCSLQLLYSLTGLIKITLTLLQSLT